MKALPLQFMTVCVSVILASSEAYAGVENVNVGISFTHRSHIPRGSRRMTNFAISVSRTYSIENSVKQLV